MKMKNGPPTLAEVERAQIERRNFDRTLSPERAAGNPYPLCWLFETRIVRDFPPGCPLAAANHLLAIERWKTEAWARHSRREQGAREDLRQAHICEACARSLLPGPHIRRLRARLFGAADAMPPAPGPWDPPAAGDPVPAGPGPAGPSAEGKDARGARKPDQEDAPPVTTRWVGKGGGRR